MAQATLHRCASVVLTWLLLAGCGAALAETLGKTHEPIGSTTPMEPIRPTDSTETIQSIWPRPAWYPGQNGDALSCDNGILRIRPSKVGIVWFDFHHPAEGRWYVNKNNMNVMTLVPGSPWQNSELDHVQPSVEVITEADSRLVMRYHYHFPNGARIYLDLSLERGSPSVTFEVHQEVDSAPISGYQWHVTNGQAEAVDQLHFDGRSIYARDIPLPLPGGRVEVQHHEFIRDLKELEFRLSGAATAEPDPNNPSWMSRVLGLKQRVTWGSAMRPQDHFAYEVRDVPWQPHWGVPKTVPWIEGLWFIRNGTLIEGDRLTYSIDNLGDYMAR